DFMLPDESMVLLRVPRKNNLYTINLNNLSPKGNLACLMAKASVDESVQWHRRMGHVNYKNMNRLVKGNLVRGLPPKLFKNDHTCVACCKGKQHKASYKAITVVSSISEPLQLLYMDLFGPTSIRSIDHKYYCLVITDDYSKFCWVFFLEHKDETYPILKDFINLVENQLNKKVKAIRCDNGTEFKNAHIIELCGSKGIKRDYSNARTPQQNGVAERKNRTLIEAARTMLADSKLPTMFWTEAVRTACYVLNRVLVTSPHNKTPYALLTGNIPSVSHFKPFGCHVTILNTSDHLGKFDGKADEGYIVGYSASNRAYRVYNVHNKRVEETMNLRYLEEKPNVQGLGHEWYFDLDYLTDTLGYKRVQANQSAGTQEASTNPAGTQDADSDSECDEQVIIVPSYPSHSIQEAEPKDTSGDEVDDSPLDSAEEIFQQELARLKGQEQRATSDAKDAEELQKRASTKTVPTGSIPVPSGDTTISPGGVPVPTGSPTDSFFDDEPTTRFPSPSDLGNNEPSPGIFSSSSYDDEFGADLNNLASTVEVSPVATKRINTIHPQSLIIRDHTLAVQTRSKVNKTTTGESAFISYIHDQQRDNHTDFQHCKYVIGTKWILKNKRDARGVVVRNKAKLMDVKSTFLYGRIDEKYIAWKSTRSTFLLKHGYKRGTIDKTLFLKKHKRDIILVQVYVDDIIFGSTKKAWCDEFEALTKGEFEMSDVGELTFFLGLQVQQRPDGIFISQDKYVQEILKKFDLESSVRCSRNQVTPTTSNLEAVKKIFKYLKANLGNPQPGGCSVSRSQLQLADDGGIDDLPIAEIYSGMDNLGYVTEGKLTFYKNKFSPQWRFLVHIPYFTDFGTKSLFGDQFGSSLAVALICLSDGRKFNWSSYIFKGMLNFEGKPMQLLAAMLPQDQEGEGARKVRLSLETELKIHQEAVKGCGGKLFKKSKLRSLLYPTDVPTGAAPAGFQTKKKSMVEEDNTVKERTLKQMEDDRLGEEAAKKLHDEEQAQVDRQRTKLNKRRQQEVLASAMYYTEAPWINIMAQVEANASLFQALTKAKVESFTDAQLKGEFEKIQKALANTQVQAFRRTLKRTGPELEEPSSKQQKSIEAPFHLIGFKMQMIKTFIKVFLMMDSTDEPPILGSASLLLEVISTLLGEINALYRSNQSTKHFTTIREILHMVDRQDLLKLYGMVVTYYENHLIAGAGLMLCWRLYTLSNVHVLETVFGEVLYMFVDVSYPLSVKLMERMLKHKLEIDKDVVGNDMTTAEQLIRFIKNQIAAAQVSPV
ncbi:putative ribonuclease H-like domain-containing protein, partial [Tanacetum coccineum]